MTGMDWQPGQLREQALHPQVAAFAYGLKTVEAERTALERWVGAGNRAYGTTTFLGHRDSQLRNDANEEALLEAHLVPGGNPATSQQVRAISVVKAAQLAAGGTGISPSTFQDVLSIAADPSFRPRVPLSPTYSSGDVIPAAWWAKELLGNRQTILRAGDTIALLNGSFIHVGLALELNGRLANLIGHAELALTSARKLGGAKPIPPHAADSPRSSAGLQDPVAIRASTDVVVCAKSALAATDAVTARTASRPSGNPLIMGDSVVEQSSFLALELATSQVALAEALGFLAVVIYRTIEWLCSGPGGLPPDLASPDTMGMVQYPKAAAAELGHARLDLTSAGSSMSASTSAGIEDLWTHGTTTTLRMGRATEAMGRMLSLLEATLAAANQCSTTSVPQD